MNMRMIDKRPGPGVQDTQEPDQTAHIMGVHGELDERLCRGAEQDVIEVFLVAADECPQLSGQSKDDMEVGNRQQLLTPLLQPCLGVLVVAFGATAMAARVVGIVLLTTVITRPQVPA
jgi:hypothetical protein